MELYKQILAKTLEKQEIQVSFPNLKMDAGEIVEGVCYQAMRKIKSVLEDSTLDDAECFQKIEEIVCVFEEIGSDGGVRHDFG